MSEADANSHSITEPASSEAQRKKTQTQFAIAITVAALLTAFLFKAVWNVSFLMFVPEMLLLVTLVLPVLMWQTLTTGKTAAKIATVSSCIFWVAGIAAGMTIKPDSSAIYLADGLLLIGFVPLLYLWRFSWPWFVFGIFNFAIGIFLQALAYFDDSYFPPNLNVARHHLSQYHPGSTWWIVGALAFAFGLARLSKNLFKMIRDKTTKAQQG